MVTGAGQTAGARGSLSFEGWRGMCAAAALGLAGILQGCLGQDAGAQRMADREEQPVAPAPGAAGAETVASPGVTAAAEPADRPEAGADPYSIDTNLVVDRDVTLMCRMSGIVEEIYVDRGSRVRKGDALLRLINRDLELALQRAQITAKQKQADFDRIQQLFSERTISRAQFEETQYTLQGAEVDVLIAREELEKSFVKAPFDGLIMDRFVRVGQRVVEDDNEPLFRLTTLSPLQARLYLPEEVARSLARGDRVEVRARHLPGVSAAGSIEWISRVIDASSGTSLAIVSVPGGGPAGSLTPGTAVTVVLHRPEGR